VSETRVYRQTASTILDESGLPARVATHLQVTHDYCTIEPGAESASPVRVVVLVEHTVRTGGSGGLERSWHTVETYQKRQSTDAPSLALGAEWLWRESVECETRADAFTEWRSVVSWCATLAERGE